MLTLVPGTPESTPDSKNVFSGHREGRYHVAITAFDNIVAYQEGQGELKFDPPSDFFAFAGRRQRSEPGSPVPVNGGAAEGRDMGRARVKGELLLLPGLRRSAFFCIPEN